MAPIAFPRIACASWIISGPLSPLPKRLPGLGTRHPGQTIYPFYPCSSKRGFPIMAKILILDDLPDAVALVQKILAAKGHEVIGFTDEEQAIAWARSKDVDLLILDIKLKKLTGIEVLEEIRKVRPAVRAIMLTGYPSLETARQAKDLGALAYSVKPVDSDELEETVDRILNPSR